MSDTFDSIHDCYIAELAEWFKSLHYLDSSSYRAIPLLLLNEILVNVTGESDLLKNASLVFEALEDKYVAPFNLKMTLYAKYSTEHFLNDKLL